MSGGRKGKGKKGQRGSRSTYLDWRCSACGSRADEQDHEGDGPHRLVGLRIDFVLNRVLSKCFN